MGHPGGCGWSYENRQRHRRGVERGSLYIPTLRKCAKDGSPGAKDGAPGRLWLVRQEQTTAKNRQLQRQRVPILLAVPGLWYTDAALWIQGVRASQAKTLRGLRSLARDCDTPYTPTAILPARPGSRAGCSGWKTRHRTSLAVQQQGFDYRQQC